GRPPDEPGLAHREAGAPGPQAGARAERAHRRAPRGEPVQKIRGGRGTEWTGRARAAGEQEGQHGRDGPGAENGPPHRALEAGPLAADGALEGVDLALQPVDLRRLLRTGEGVAVDAERVARVAAALVRVAEVLRHGRILARELDRALELLDRLPVVAALVVHPPEAVDVEPVVGLDLERAADEVLGLVELHAHLGVGVAEVV